MAAGAKSKAVPGWPKVGRALQLTILVRMSPASNLTLTSPNGQLASIDVYITSQCNRRCTYCFLPAEFFTSGMRMNMERFAGVPSLAGERRR